MELNGGNDGLNTIMFYTDRRYYQLRPRLAVSHDSVLRLSERLGFNPALEPLMQPWKNQDLALVLGVGCPRPNRSHFRSIEIWETASNSKEVLQQGWIACLFSIGHPPANFAADGIIFDHGDAGLLSGHNMRNIIMHSPEQFLKQASRMKEISQTSRNKALSYLLSVQSDTLQAARLLRERLRQAPTLYTSFPKSHLGRQLEITARLLVGQIPVAVVKVPHDSCDTRSNQSGQHDRLLRELAEALAAFRKSIREAGLWDRVLVMTYSGFGRRVAENGSAGIDHGTSAPHFLLGGRVKGGFYGAHPSLGDLMDGDLRHHVDYSSLYVTVARRWWNLRGDFLQNRDYPAINYIG